MAECKFCNTPIGGDIPNDHEYLIDFEETERNAEIIVSIGNQEVTFHEDMPYSVWADIMNNKIIVCVNEERIDCEGLRSIEAEKAYSIDINFCPICGRRLKNEKED